MSEWQTVSDAEVTITTENGTNNATLPVGLDTSKFYRLMRKY